MTADRVALVDSHAHLMDPVFRADLDLTVERAKGAGVERVVCVGYDAPTSRAAVDLARRFPSMRAVVGIHPNDSAGATVDDFAAILSLVESPEVVGVGETGLDYYRDRATPEQQRAALGWHLRLAEGAHLPVVIHNREADGDVALALESSAGRRPSGEPPGVLHCFSSADPGFLGRMIDAGYYVSFAGPLTFKSAGALQDQAGRVPLDRLLVETDCPYLAPVPHRGRRNEPAYVRATAERLAEIQGLSIEALARHIWSNTIRLFPALDGAGTEATA